MTNEPFRLQKDHTVSVNEETLGNSRVTRVKILRNDGTVEREIIETRPMWPSWMDE